jgi:MFS transporter, DHA1 family, tetracycline resistance protein
VVVDTSDAQSANPSPAAMPRPGSKGALSVVLVTVLLDSVGFSMVMPVMPALIQGLTGEGLSAAATWGGWLLVVFAVTQFVFAPLLGNLSDRYGRRPVLLYSLFAFGVDYMIMGFSPTIAWLFLGRIMSGIPGASFTAATAYVADVSTPESRAKNFGLVGSAAASGFVIGPAFGGLLGLLGPRAPFFAASALAFVNFAFGYFVLKESLAVGSRREFSWRRANPVGGLRQIRKYPQVMGLAFALMLWWLAIQAYPTTWSFYTMFRFGWSQAAIGLSLAAYGAVIAFSQARLPQIVLPRLGETRTVVVGLLLAGLAFVGQSLATEGWQVFAWVPVWFLASLSMPTMNAMMSRQVPPDAQGELQGVNASLFGISAIIGPFVMAELFGIFSAADAPVFFPGMGFFVAALVALVAAGLVIRAVRRPLVAPASSVDQPHAAAPSGAELTTQADGGRAFDDVS